MPSAAAPNTETAKSDECVTWKDVAQADVDTAIEWLLANDPE